MAQKRHEEKGMDEKIIVKNSWTWLNIMSVVNVGNEMDGDSREEGKKHRRIAIVNGRMERNEIPFVVVSWWCIVNADGSVVIINIAPAIIYRRLCF